MRTRGAIGPVALVGLASLAGLPSGALAARVTSRAPTVAEDAAIVHAFYADRHHRGKPIVEIRVTRQRQGHRVARVTSINRRVHASAARADAPAARATGDAYYEVDYYSWRPTGEWKRDDAVSRKLAHRLHPVPDFYDVRFTGSGTDTTQGYDPGELPSNPDCRVPAKTVNGKTAFRFHIEFREGLSFQASTAIAIDGIDASGTSTTAEQPGCVHTVSDGDGHPVQVPTPTAPATHCSVGWHPVTTDDKLAFGHSHLTRTTDSHGNHELRLNLPTESPDNPGCAAPDGWTRDSSGPVVFLHSILIPDSELARGKPIVRNLRYSVKPFCASGFGGSKCSEQLAWSGKVILTPQPLPKLANLHFEGPAPEPSAPVACNCTRD